MKIITNIQEIHLEEETAVAIGKFDGLHIGHRRLLDRILAEKKNGLKACVFTFDPAPAVLFGFSDGKELTTREEKRKICEAMGIDLLIEFPMTYETAATPARQFAEDILADRMNAKLIVAGNDLSFGDKGAGNTELLRQVGEQKGFRVETVEKVSYEGTDVSSTYVRRTVEAGDMLLAEQLLGMPYPVCGEVLKGNQIGRTLGFPTLNQIPVESKLLPPNGVYFSVARVGGKLYKAISNVGTKPTVGDGFARGVETYLYDFNENIYGEDITVYLSEFRRPEQRFASLEALKRQLEEDITAGAAKNVGNSSKYLL